MTNMAMYSLYQVFGLTVASAIPLPELLPASLSRQNVDVVIEEDDLSELWSQLASPQKLTFIQKDFFMFQLPDIAIFCIQAGNKIIVSPMVGADWAQIRLYLLGTCLGTILIQNEILPLHGSAIVINGKAYGIVGDSGIGKSTLASLLIKRGYSLLTDDIIAVKFSSDNTALVMPTYPQQKLWRESLTELGMESANYTPIYDRENKYIVPVSGAFVTEPIPLAALFELVISENEEIEVQTIPKLQALQTLYHHTYRNFLIPGFDSMEWHFKVSTKLAQHVDIYQIARPSTGFSAPDLADLILATIAEEVKS